jgi:cobalt-zinc-cadmium efflux system membrane fusion protein
MKTLYISMITLSALLITSCGRNKQQESGTETAGHEHTESISVTERQMQAVDIRLGEIEQRDLNSIVRANGQMELDPQKKADVNSLTGGIIRRILVTEGKQVTAGQVLAYLENTDIVELQKNYLTTQRESTVAEQDYIRQKELFAQGAGVEKSMQQATANYEIAKARLVGLTKQLQQLSIDPEQVSTGHIVTQIPVKAPISGAIHGININTGSYVDIQTPLMYIGDNSQLHCDLKVFEKDIHSVRIGQEVDIILTNQPRIILKGVIYEINKSFEDETKAIPVHVNLKDKGGATLISGMYVTALINTGKQKTDAVPNDAIVSMEGRNYIFALADETVGEEGKAFHFRLVEVYTGISELGFTQITPLEELAQGTKIVKSNAFYIASMLDEGEEEH